MPCGYLSYYVAYTNVGQRFFMCNMKTQPLLFRNRKTVMAECLVLGTRSKRHGHENTGSIHGAMVQYWKVRRTTIYAEKTQKQDLAVIQRDCCVILVLQTRFRAKWISITILIVS